jgi:hypothetical protein
MHFPSREEVGLIAFAALIATFSSGVVRGQVNTASVTGTVTDPSGAAIPNAKIEARNELTNVQTVASSNNQGRFDLPYLPIGTYDVAVSGSGFQTLTQNGIELTAGQVLDLKLTLTVGKIQQTVEVSTQASALSYETVDQHSVVDERGVSNLPLAKLDWTGLLVASNGVSQAGNSGVSINGLPPASFKLTVDGTSASSDPELPSVGFYQGFNQINTVNSDAIAEVSVTKGITPASVSGSMSGNINIITKSGSNASHGTLLEFNSLNDYNARNQFLTTNPRSTSNQFGASLGGPILKNKLFFFVNYQGIRVSAFDALSGTVPTPLFDSQALAAQPRYASELALFPLPNTSYSSTATTATWNGARALVQNDNNAVGRIDYYINASNWITLRYNDSHPYKDSPRVIAEDPRISSGISDSFNLGYTHSSLGWTETSRIGYIRTDIARLDLLYSYGFDELKVSGLDTQGGEDFQIRGGTYTAEQTVSTVRGRHSLEFGAIYLRLRTGRHDDTTTTFSYSNNTDFFNNVPNQIQINFPLEPFSLHMDQFGGFVQDNFRATSNLTINMGLRYDYWTVPKESDNRLYNRNPGPLGLGTGSLRSPDSLYNADVPNFAPRLGLAWSPRGDRKTVLRAGSGLFFNPHTIFGGPVDDVLDNPAVPFRLTLAKSQAAAENLIYPVNKTALMNQLIAAGAPTATTSISSNFPNPYSIQWYAGVQRQLPFGLVLDTAYVGNRGLHINMTRTINLPDRLTGVVPDPAFGSFRYYDTSDSSWYDSWQTSLLKTFSHGLNFGLNYNWAHNIAYGDADLQIETVPQDNNNIRAERGPTPFDIRQSFRANFLYMPEILKWTGLHNRAAKTLIDGWQFTGILVANTGAPVNITNGNSANSTDRPDLTTSVDSTYDNYQSTLVYLNKAAFTAVPISSLSGLQIRPGDLGRYALRAPGVWNLDFSAAKNFAINERYRLQLRGDAFNSLNHTNLGGLVTDTSKSTFGRLTSATSRTVQIGAKLLF